MTDSLEALIKDLEAAAEGDRGLDDRIHFIIKNGVGCGANRSGPLYTTSIDSAKTLVPDGWEWMVSNRAPKSHAGRAYINNRELILGGGGGMNRNPRYRGHECTAATPELAMCIVCLRALQAAGPARGRVGE